MDWERRYASKLVSGPEAIAAAVHSGSQVYLTGNCSVPRTLVEALVAHGPNVEDVEVPQPLTVGDAPWCSHPGIPD